MPVPTRSLILAAALAALMAPMAMAESNSPVDTATDARVRAQMTALGYEVRSIVSEDGMFEVYALKNGEKVQLLLDKDLKIVGSEANG